MEGCYRNYGPCAKIPASWYKDPNNGALPDVESRWLYICLWLMAVEDRSSVLSEYYSPDYLALVSGVAPEKIQPALRALARRNFIGTLPPELGERLVIRGVREAHKSIRRWKEEEPDEVLNPWRKNPEYEWQPRESTNKRTNTNECANNSGDKNKRKSKNENNRRNREKGESPNPNLPDPLDNYPILKKEFDNLRLLIEQAHPDCRIQFSRPGTEQYHQERRTLERLVRLDEFDEQTVVDVLKWVLTDGHQDARFWRNNFRSLSNLRKRCRNDATKFQAMHAVWRAAGNLTSKEIDEFLRREGLA